MISDIEKAYFFTSGPLFFITLLGVLSSRKVFFCMKFTKFTQAKTLWWHFFKTMKSRFFTSAKLLWWQNDFGRKTVFRRGLEHKFHAPQKTSKVFLRLHRRCKKLQKKRCFNLQLSIMCNFVVNFRFQILTYLRVKIATFQISVGKHVFFLNTKNTGHMRKFQCF